jgi:ABC-type Zn uptake system ZnuABC Zn-binding protein ZnuA
MLKKSLLNNSFRAIFTFISIGFFGCQNQTVNTAFMQTTTTIDENLPRVVATSSVLCDLTKQVAENTINLICLGSPGNDSYFYQLRPGDREAIAQADMIFYSGYNFKPQLRQILTDSQNSAPQIPVNQLVVSQPQQFQTSGQTLTNPHIWHDVNNAMKMVDIISQNLQKLQPDNATFYRDNTTAIKDELTQLDTWIKSTLNTIPDDRRKLITSSNILNYYATAYRIPLVVGLNGINNQPPTNAQVKTWQNNIQQAQVTTIFAETTINPELIAPVVTETNVRLSRRKLYTYGLSEPGTEADTYQKLMVANTRTIVEGLGGTYLIFTPLSPQHKNQVPSP